MEQIIMHIFCFVLICVEKSLKHKTGADLKNFVAKRLMPEGAISTIYTFKRVTFTDLPALLYSQYPTWTGRTSLYLD